MSRRVVAVLVAGLFAAVVLAIGLHTADATAPRQPGPDPEAVERRRALYLRGCASCHGAAGEGTSQGPDLVGVGAAAADFQLSTGRMPNTAPDRQSVTKPSPYTRKQIDDLVAYVASLGPGPPIPDVITPPGDLQEGAQLYLQNCAACHSAAGNGGALNVEYLKKPENPGGLSLGLVGPITEGLVAILIGLGGLMLVSRWIEPRAVREEPPAVTATEEQQ